MATITERFGFTKPAGSDPASIVPLNSNTDLIEQYLGRTQDMIAPMYDDTATYDVGDIVTYESNLYKCITAISTAETFDPTKWKATTAVEEGSGGGGGSSVIPNPTGTPTDTLSTVSIDGTIFNIEGSGGGSGSGYTETTLWSGSVTPSSSETVTLDSSLSNYDFIAFEATISGNDGCLIYPASYIMSLDDIVGCIYSSSSMYGNIWIQAIDNMSISLKKAVSGQNVTYTKIVGIKIESSGSGSSYEETSLFSGQTASTDIGVAINLNGNISDYDAIVINCGRESEGDWRHGYLWYLTSDISIGQWLLQIINENDHTTAYWNYNSDSSITWASAYAAYPVTLFSIKGLKFGSGGGGGGTPATDASEVEYDNTTSQLTADNVQEAIDEVVANADTASEDILTLQNVQGYDAYDETQTYAVGDYAIYNNHVYECTTAVSTAEPFDSSKWTQTSIEQIIDGVKGDVSQLNSSFANSLNNLKFKFVSKTITIPDGSISSPKTVDIDLSSDLPTGASIVSVPSASVGAYRLPYTSSSGVSQTWIYRVINSTTVVIENTTTGWGTATIYLLLAYS